ncbi:MAG: CPBP family intramembrane metalloprotease [Planctomycetota bacterium]|nr:CPBP family intramembrane metalloprotease [Planctomycetota bacterium]
MLSDLHGIRAGPGSGQEGGGFLTRDILRFFAVDIVLILLLRLMLGLGLFATPDIYVCAILASKVILLCYLVWLIRDRRGAWPETGATTAGRWWAWPLSLALYAGYVQAQPYIGSLNISLMEHAYGLAGRQYIPEPQDVMLYIFSGILNQPTRLILVFFTVLAGPFMEELAFRGMGFDAYRRAGGLARALVWTSVLFGLFHFRLDLILPLGLLGLLFGIVRAFSRTVWCAILVHCLHNALAIRAMARELGLFSF